MKAQALLILTVLLVLCHFATVTLGGLVFSRFKVKDLTKTFEELNTNFKGADACFKTAKEYFQTLEGESSEASVVESVDPEASKTHCSISIPNLEGKKQKSEENFYRRRIFFEDNVVEFCDPETSGTHSFISIPDLEGKDHVYVVQVAPVLGNGQFGKVYLAKDIENPNEFVAIKKSAHVFPDSFQQDVVGLKAIGELLGMKADSLVLVMPFVPGIRLLDLAETEYNGRLVREYWKDNKNNGLKALLYRIARDVVAPLMNKYIIHKDLSLKNMMVAQTDGNYIPTETDPSTGLQHFRAIDFGMHEKVEDGRNILKKTSKAGLSILQQFKHLHGEWLTVGGREWLDLIEKFQKDVVGALDKNKFDIVMNKRGMLISVIKKKETEAAVVPDDRVDCSLFHLLSSCILSAD